MKQNRIPRYFIENKGYVSFEEVKDMINKGIPFGIYKNSKGNRFIVTNIDTVPLTIESYTINRKKIHFAEEQFEKRNKNACGVLVFDSLNNNMDELNNQGWNGNQIILYEADNKAFPFGAFSLELYEHLCNKYNTFLKQDLVIK